MENLIVPATSVDVIADVEQILSTLKEKYGFKEDVDDLPFIMENPAPGRTKYLVLIANKITLERIIEAENIKCWLELDNVLDFSRYQFMLPPRNAVGYFLWMSAGELYREEAPGQAESFLKQNERGAMLHEGLQLFSQYGARDNLASPDQGTPFMDFPGSRDAYGSVPYLHRWHGKL